MWTGLKNCNILQNVSFCVPWNFRWVHFGWIFPLITVFLECFVWCIKSVFSLQICLARLGAQGNIQSCFSDGRLHSSGWETPVSRSCSNTQTCKSSQSMADNEVILWTEESYSRTIPRVLHYTAPLDPLESTKPLCTSYKSNLLHWIDQFCNDACQSFDVQNIICLNINYILYLFPEAWWTCWTGTVLSTREQRYPIYWLSQTCR